MAGVNEYLDEFARLTGAPPPYSAWADYGSGKEINWFGLPPPAAVPPVAAPTGPGGGVPASNSTIFYPDGDPFGGSTRGYGNDNALAVSRSGPGATQAPRNVSVASPSAKQATPAGTVSTPGAAAAATFSPDSAGAGASGSASWNGMEMSFPRSLGMEPLGMSIFAQGPEMATGLPLGAAMTIGRALTPETKMSTIGPHVPGVPQTSMDHKAFFTDIGALDAKGNIIKGGLFDPDGDGIYDSTQYGGQLAQGWGGKPKETWAQTQARIQQQPGYAQALAAAKTRAAGGTAAVSPAGRTAGLLGNPSAEQRPQSGPGNTDGYQGGYRDGGGRGNDNARDSGNRGSGGGRSRSGEGNTGAAQAGSRDRSVNRADGGLIEGPGGPRDDAIKANVSAGEFVLPTDVVASLGRGSVAQGGRKLEQLVAAMRAGRASGTGTSATGAAGGGLGGAIAAMLDEILGPEGVAEEFHRPITYGGMEPGWGPQPESPSKAMLPMTKDIKDAVHLIAATSPKIGHAIAADLQRQDDARFYADGGLVLPPWDPDGLGQMGYRSDLPPDDSGLGVSEMVFRGVTAAAPRGGVPAATPAPGTVSIGRLPGIAEMMARAPRETPPASVPNAPRSTSLPMPPGIKPSVAKAPRTSAIPGYQPSTADRGIPGLLDPRMKDVLGQLIAEGKERGIAISVQPGPDAAFRTAEQQQALRDINPRATLNKSFHETGQATDIQVDGEASNSPNTIWAGDRFVQIAKERGIPAAAGQNFDKPDPSHLQLGLRDSPEFLSADGTSLARFQPDFSRPPSSEAIAMAAAAAAQMRAGLAPKPMSIADMMTRAKAVMGPGLIGGAGNPAVVGGAGSDILGPASPIAQARTAAAQPRSGGGQGGQRNANATSQAARDNVSRQTGRSYAGSSGRSLAR